MIIFALYTGQRLGDIATLNWEQVEFESCEIRLTTQKTSRQQKIPILAPLLRHIEKVNSKQIRSGSIHPKADSIYEAQRRTGTLSRQFSEIMAKAGITEKKSHQKQKEGEGRAARRTASKVSFHSLRHTTTSLLKNAGVSSAIAEEFVGHDSAEMNRVYTHIEQSSMKRAADTLPDVVS